MTYVRFREKYCADINNRLSYELVSDEPELHWCWLKGEERMFYKTKLIGLVPTEIMEITTDPNDKPAIEIFVKLSNI